MRWRRRRSGGRRKSLIRSLWYASELKDSLPPTNITSNGVTYETSAEVKVTKSGIVSLAAAKGLVISVKCYENATVVVRLREGFDESMKSLFPIGAVLVVSEKVFGPCTLFPSNYTSKLRATFVGTSDGYLRIQSRVGTPQDAVLTGEVVTFLSLFDTAKITARRILSPEVDGPSGRRLAVIGKVSKEWKVTDDLKLEVSMKGTNRCNFDTYDLKRGDFGWEYGFEAILDLTMELEASLTFDAGLNLKYPKEGQPRVERVLTEIPLYGVSMSALKKLAKLVKLELPNVQAGIFLEMLFGIEAQAKMEAKFGPTLTMKASTGRKAIAPYVYGSADIVLWPPGVDVEIGAGLKDQENTGASFTANLAPGAAITKPVKIDGSVFVYFKPQIVLASAPLFSLNAPSKAGLNLGAKVGFPFFPLDPLKYGDVVKLGSCDTCHFLQLSADGKLTSGNVKVTLLEGVPGLEKDKELPSFKFELTKEIAKACILKQYGDDTVTCGDKLCCDGGYQKCQSGTCVLDDANCGGDRCCPACTGTETCCKGSCIPTGGCCPACTGTDICCGGICVALYDCCRPSCEGTHKCCHGTCIASTDPCIDNGAPCSSFGYTGKCMDKNACKKNGGVTVSGLCQGPTNIQCCLDGPDVPECTANDMYPGECTTIDQCHSLAGRTPLSPTQEFGCSGGQICCVNSPVTLLLAIVRKPSGRVCTLPRVSTSWSPKMEWTFALVIISFNAASTYQHATLTD